MAARCFVSPQPSSLPDKLNTSKHALEQTFCFQGDVLQITADVCRTESKKPPTANRNQVKTNLFGLFSSGQWFLWSRDRSATIQHTKRISKLDSVPSQSSRIFTNIWLIFGVNSHHCQWVRTEPAVAKGRRSCGQGRIVVRKMIRRKHFELT